MAGPANGALSERRSGESKGIRSPPTPSCRLNDRIDDAIVVMVPWVYILRCGDGTFYVGHCSDLDSRIARHAAGVGSRYTSTRLPVTICYSEVCPDVDAALRRERQLKGWTAQKKAALADGDFKRLRQLSRRRRS